MEPIKKKRGFAALTPERLREIASKGGKSAHAKGTAHQYTAEEAKAAGRLGGRKTQADKRTIVSGVQTCTPDIANEELLASVPENQPPQSFHEEDHTGLVDTPPEDG